MFRGDDSNDDGETEFNLWVLIYRPLEEDEARLFVIQVARALQNAINQHPYSHRYISALPIGKNRISVDVLVCEHQDNALPYLVFTGYQDGEIYYFEKTSNNNTSIYDYKHTETLEEALAKLGETQF